MEAETVNADLPRRKLLFERIYDAVLEPEELSEPPEEVVQWSTTTFYSGILTFFVAGLNGARKAAEAHIEANRSTVYQTKVHAQREVNYAASRGFLRTGSQWGLGMMAFTGLFTGLYLFLEDLRESRDVANAGASGAVTGAVMGAFKGGIHRVPRGTVLGAVLGTVGGGLMQGLWRLEDMLDTPEMKAERAHAKQLERDEKVRKYNERLKITSSIVAGLQASLDAHEQWEKGKK